MKTTYLPKKTASQINPKSVLSAVNRYQLTLSWGGREKIQIIPREQYETFVKTEGELECLELVWKDYKKGSEPTMEYVMSSYRSWNLPTRRIFRRVLFKPSFSLSKAKKMKIRRAQVKKRGPSRFLMNNEKPFKIPIGTPYPSSTYHRRKPSSIFHLY